MLAIRTRVARHSDWTYDNLNRMTASPLRVYENDILGNRTWTNRTSQTLAVKYNWDLLNRMSATANISTGGARYEYRADGMRVLKVEGLSLVWVEEAESEEEEQEEEQEEGSGYWDEYWASNKPTTRYYYEGQMGIEEDFTRKVSGQDQTDLIRHGLGARGIDFIETDAYNASPSGAYPLYDGHGNMIATLTKQPTNSFSLSARRYTDSWGVTRVGASTGKPDQRYCANLGHRQDDESGLTYMRARYYEPTTGRFVSEDPAMDGGNWFVYCENVPTMTVDSTGREGEWIYLRGISMFALMMSGVGTLMASVGVALFMLPSAQKLSLLSGLVSNTAICWSLVVTFGWQEGSASVGAVSTVLAAAEGFAGVIANIVAGLGFGCGPAVGRGLAITAITAATAHSLWLFAYLVQASVEPYDGS